MSPRRATHPAGEAASEPLERSPIDVLSDIKHGKIDPSVLNPATRLPLVEFLIGEGVSIAEIAQLLKRGERTIRRDLEQIRSANALQVGEEFALEHAGELLVGSRVSIARLLRNIRDKDCPIATRIDGERAIMEIRDRVTARLQSMGYLPTATHRVRADMTHHLGEPPDLDAILAEVQRITGISDGAEGTGQLAKMADLTRVLVDAQQPATPQDAPDSQPTAPAPTNTPHSGGSQ